MYTKGAKDAFRGHLFGAFRGRYRIAKDDFDNAGNREKTTLAHLSECVRRCYIAPMSAYKIKTKNKNLGEFHNEEKQQEGLYYR